MSLQYYIKDDNGKLVEDGEEIVLEKGDTGYVRSNRIHSAKYIKECKLVYVYDKAFGFFPSN